MNKPEIFRPHLSFEPLDDRIVPVVGALGDAPTVLAGQGFDGVVYIQSGGGAGTGGLLLDGNHILTAAHVVTNDMGQVNPGDTTVSFDLVNVGRVNFVVPAANITVHPGWTGVGADDLAIITLPSLAPSGPGLESANRYQLYRETDQVGKDITIVGYGSFGTGTTGEQPPDGVNKRIANNRYDALGDQFGFPNSLLYDVDNGTARNDAFGRILGINQTGVPNEGTGARGDSGGPVFIFVNGTPFIAGTTTSGPEPQNPPNPAVLNPAVMAGIGSISLDTRISEYAAWIDGVTDAPRPLVVDLRVQVAGFDAAADAILVRVANGNLEVLVNGSVYQSQPLARVTQLTLIGAGDVADPFQSTATIDASVPQALTIVYQRILQVVDNRTATTTNPPANAVVLPPAPVQAPPEVRPTQVFDLDDFPNALNPTRLTAVGAGPGGSPRVQVFDSRTGAVVRDFLAFDASFTGGVRTAVGDINGDFVDDIIVAAGSGGGPRVKVIDGASGAVIRDFFAFDPSFTGGVWVASGDVDGDGTDDLVTAAGSGGGSHVKVFSGADGTLDSSFFAYAGYTGGVTVAVGDVDGDGFADVITGTQTGAPHVKVFAGFDGALLRSFFAYGASFGGGVFVSAGDVDGDGFADVVTGAGAGGAPHVKVFSGVDQSVLSSYFAYDGDITAGVRVAVLDSTGDGRTDIATGAGPTSTFQPMKVFGGDDLTQTQANTLFGGTFLGGVFVGGRG